MSYKTNSLGVNMGRSLIRHGNMPKIYQEIQGEKYLHLDALLQYPELHKQKMQELKQGDLLCTSNLKEGAYISTTLMKVSGRNGEDSNIHVTGHIIVKQELV